MTSWALGATACLADDNNFGAPPPRAPAIDVKLGGVTIGHVLTTVSQGFSAPINYWDVLIQLDADGTLDVRYNNAAIYTNFATGYAPILGGRFGFGARTGGANDNHWIDNLRIETQAPSTVPEPATLALLALGLAGLAGRSSAMVAANCAELARPSLQIGTRRSGRDADVSTWPGRVPDRNWRWFCAVFVEL